MINYTLIPVWPETIRLRTTKLQRIPVDCPLIEEDDGAIGFTSEDAKEAFCAAYHPAQRDPRYWDISGLESAMAEQCVRWSELQSALHFQPSILEQWEKGVGFYAYARKKIAWYLGHDPKELFQRRSRKTP